MKFRFYIAFPLLILSPNVFAYVGPGMGGGVIIAILGFILAIFLAIFGILYYPLKRAFRNRKKKVNKEKK